MRRFGRPDGRVLFAGGVTLLAAWALAQTTGWPIKTALYPRVVGIPLLALAIAETVLSLRGREDERHEAVDVTLSTEVPPRVAGRRTAAVITWMGGFYLGVLLIGFPRAVPLFVFAYLRGQAGESWITALLLAASAWLGFTLLFVNLLHIPFADGILWRLFVR
ncbi:MAG: tripartite tricarboxylate transporter TctB family protein [Armatimonadota bacterium]|nr:tripartite tricarboxylate transporter TctB family protein [Armatimonadota bacterium]MDR7519761.1 tripartite tricarboxylate transporter TctB family protein [Armatimonadota bacterium]MDR7549974.1 tripartite tricarboxylate transporter TctB family protein [Armatimonadota bacterium]